MSAKPRDKTVRPVPAEKSAIPASSAARRETRARRMPVGAPATAMPSVKTVDSNPTPPSEKPYSRRTSGATSGNSCRSIALTTYDASSTPNMVTPRTPRSVRGGSSIPVEDLLAGPEDDAGPRMNVFKGLAKIPQSMTNAHDVRMHHERHDPRRILGVGVELLELVDRTVAIFRRLVMLNQHHRHVVALLRIRH